MELAGGLDLSQENWKKRLLSEMLLGVLHGFGLFCNLSF